MLLLKHPLIATLLIALACQASADLHAREYLSFKTDDEANTMEVFRRASPAVVYVTHTAIRRDVFNFNVYEIPRGSGTGFVWDRRGHVVTNFHVVRGADRVSVTLQDGSEWPARLVGAAPEKDLAVLRIEAEPDRLATLPVGDSDELEVGRKVLAIGNPFGLDTTLTTGVVSALGREINAPGNRKIRDVIQTDAAVNPGNSGGPLLNSLGQLVGVNTAIFSPSGAYAGISFAIPVNTVKRYVPQLIANGRISRPVLGIEMASDRWARANGIRGVVITQVLPGSPAERAGLRGPSRDPLGKLRLGDVIVGLDDEAVNTIDELLAALEQRAPGDRVELETRLGQERRRVRVTLGRDRQL
jgi:S1-C subfamily serine protease